MKELERLIPLWNIIKDGSVQCELSQENKMLTVHLTSDTLTIDIKDPKGLKLVWPLIRNFIRPRMRTRDHIKERGSVLLGVLVSFRAKGSGIANHLSMIQELATMLYENEKCVIIKENGKQLAKIGHGARSFGMRLLNLNHIEVSDLSALMRLLDEIMVNL